MSIVDEIVDGPWGDRRSKWGDGVLVAQARLAILRSAVRRACAAGSPRPKCPECPGVLDAHHTGCPVWDALYGE